MRLSEYVDRVVADLAAALPSVDVDAHGGEFDLVEMQRYGLCPPLARVWLPKVLSASRGKIECQFTASVVARRTSPAHSASFNALSIVNATLLILDSDSLASDAGSAPEQISADNQWDRYVAMAGMHFWRVSWRQVLQSDDAAQDLQDFLTLFATYRNPEGAVVATDLVAIPQE